MDVVQDLAVARIGLGEFLHVVDELTGHSGPGATALPSRWALGADVLEFAADVASGYVKGKPPQGQSDAPRPGFCAFSTTAATARSAGAADAVAQLYRDDSARRLRR